MEKFFCFVVKTPNDLGHDSINELLSMENAQLVEKTCIQLKNGEQRFSCPLCKSVKYTQLRYLKSHIKECGLTFLCHICKLSYKQKRTFMHHMRLKHPSLKYQSWMNCFCTFISKYSHWKRRKKNVDWNIACKYPD